MARKLVLVLLVVLSILCAGCGGAEAPSVDEVVVSQTEKVEAGQACNMTWIKGNLDISSKLQQLRACAPAEADQEAYNKLLDKTVRKCLKICTDTFGAESEEYNTCVAQCKGE